jgi:hypothetical protein
MMKDDSKEGGKVKTFIKTCLQTGLLLIQRWCEYPEVSDTLGKGRHQVDRWKDGRSGVVGLVEDY